MEPKRFNLLPISAILLVAALFLGWRALRPVPILTTLRMNPAGFKVVSNGKGFSSNSTFTVYVGSPSDFLTFYNQLPALGQSHRGDIPATPANYSMFVIGSESQFPPYDPQLFCGEFSLKSANGTPYMCRFVKADEGQQVRLYILSTH